MTRDELLVDVEIRSADLLVGEESQWLGNAEG